MTKISKSVSLKNVLVVTIPLLVMASLCWVSLKSMVDHGLPVIHVYKGLLFGTTAIGAATAFFLLWNKYAPRRYDPHARIVLWVGGPIIVGFAILFNILVRMALLNLNGTPSLVSVNEVVADNVVDSLEADRPSIAYKANSTP